MSILQALAGLKTLLAFVTFLVVTVLNKRWHMGIQPTTIASVFGSVVLVLRLFPGKPLTPKARKVAIVLAGLSAALAVGLQYDKKLTVEVLRWAPDFGSVEAPPAQTLPASLPQTPPVSDPQPDVDTPSDYLDATPDVLGSKVDVGFPGALAFGLVVPAVPRRRWRRMVVVAALVVVLSGCCSLCPSVKADRVQGEWGVCWAARSLAKTCTLPDGTKLTTDECSLRQKRAALYVERHAIDCDALPL